MFGTRFTSTLRLLLEELPDDLPRHGVRHERAHGNLKQTQLVVQRVREPDQHAHGHDQRRVHRVHGDAVPTQQREHLLQHRVDVHALLRYPARLAYERDGVRRRRAVLANEREEKRQEPIAHVLRELVRDPKVQEHEPDLAFDRVERRRGRAGVRVGDLVQVKQNVPGEHLEVRVDAVRAERLVVLAPAADRARQRLASFKRLHEDALGDEPGHGPRRVHLSLLSEIPPESPQVLRLRSQVRLRGHAVRELPERLLEVDPLQRENAGRQPRRAFQYLEIQKDLPRDARVANLHGDDAPRGVARGGGQRLRARPPARDRGRAAPPPRRQRPRRLFSRSRARRLPSLLSQPPRELRIARRARARHLGFQHAPVHLRDGPARDRLRGEVLEDVPGRDPELFAYDLLRVFPRVPRRVVVQRAHRLAKVLREDVPANGRPLRPLHERGAAVGHRGVKRLPRAPSHRGFGLLPREDARGAVAAGKKDRAEQKRERAQTRTRDERVPRRDRRGEPERLRLVLIRPEPAADVGV
eukprot:30130-Pelagococcus_subviridis.AAC.2